MNDTVKEGVDTSALLAGLKNKTNPEAPVAEPPVESKASVPEYQQYNASRVSTCMITPTGKRINFTNYMYHTKDPEIIRFLDSEIQQGLVGITKGKLLAVEDLDPEAAKRRQIIEEFKASQEGREFGNTKPETQRSGALSTDGVAN